MSYAQSTEVSVEKSKAEIERTLSRYGAAEFASGWKSGRAMLQFKMRERIIRFVLPLPDRNDRRFTHVKKGRSSHEAPRKEGAALAAWEQACRQRWRALLLAIKAKLESAESGIEQFETAFMGQIVLPNDATVEEMVLPEISRAYLTGIVSNSLCLTNGEG
jgi:hypothetical protein